MVSGDEEGDRKDLTGADAPFNHGGLSMKTIPVQVKHRGVAHEVSVELPENFEEFRRTFGEREMFLYAIKQLKTERAGEAWGKIEKDAKGETDKPTRRGWMKDLEG